GTETAKRRWLRALRRADVVGCQLFSEPGAGSDLASVSTKADRDPATGDWIVTGQKVWTSGAHYSDLGLLLARTSDGERHRNLTAFLVDMHAPGVEVRPLRQMTGGADFNEVFLDGVRVPDENRLGEVDGGWQVAMATLMYERGAIGGSTAGGSGLFRLERIIAWLQDLGRTDDPAVRQAFARVHIGLTAAKAMRARAEAAVKAGTTPGPEMSLSKLALTANLAALSDLVATALGPKLLADTGRRSTFSWAEFVLGVPGMRLGGGTDGIQRDIIAHRVLGLPKEPRTTTCRGREWEAWTGRSGWSRARAGASAGSTHCCAPPKARRSWSTTWAVRRTAPAARSGLRSRWSTRSKRRAARPWPTETTSRIPPAPPRWSTRRSRPSDGSMRWSTTQASCATAY